MQNRTFIINWKTGPIPTQEHMVELGRLERYGIIREELPEPDVWRFTILKPEVAPAWLLAEAQ